MDLGREQTQLRLLQTSVGLLNERVKIARLLLAFIVRSCKCQMRIAPIRLLPVNTSNILNRLALGLHFLVLL